MSGPHFEANVDAFGSKAAVRVWNDEVEVIASTSYGPRILAYRFLGGPNVFGFLPPSEQEVDTPFGEPWHIYGGHRLWHAPEHPVESYIPDNSPVETSFDGSQLLLRRAVEPVTRLKKEIRVTLGPRGSSVQVSHHITNCGSSPVVLAVWATTVMATGGEAIFPLPTYVPFPQRLLPVSRLVVWPYTRLGDARFRFGAHYVRLRQDARATVPQKVGFLDEEHGWAAYAVGGLVFVKRYLPATPGLPLVDFGCNVETFTDGRILELETLGPEVRLGPGEETCHEETWELFQGVAVPEDDEAATPVLTPLVTRSAT